LELRNFIAAELAERIAVIARAVVDLEVVVAGLDRQRIEAEVDRRASFDYKVAHDAACVLGWDRD
jgi:hypothetical protein